MEGRVFCLPISVYIFGYISRKNMGNKPSEPPPPDPRPIFSEIPLYLDDSEIPVGKPVSIIPKSRVHPNTDRLIYPDYTRQIVTGILTKREILPPDPHSQKRQSSKTDYRFTISFNDGPVKTWETDFNSVDSPIYYFMKTDKPTGGGRRKSKHKRRTQKRKTHSNRR